MQTNDGAAGCWSRSLECYLVEKICGWTMVVRMCIRIQKFPLRQLDQIRARRGMENLTRIGVIACLLASAIGVMACGSGPKPPRVYPKAVSSLPQAPATNAVPSVASPAMKS
jgi:hypothetical protein